MKLSRVIDPRFKDILKKLMKEPLPLRTAYKLKGIITKTDQEYEKYEELRKVALNRLGKKTEDGSLELDADGNVVFEGDNLKAFVAELNDLVNVNVEVEKIKVADLGDKIQISAEELIIADDILEA